MTSKDYRLHKRGNYCLIRKRTTSLETGNKGQIKKKTQYKMERKNASSLTGLVSEWLVWGLQCKLILRTYTFPFPTDRLIKGSLKATFSDFYCNAVSPWSKIILQKYQGTILPKY